MAKRVNFWELPVEATQPDDTLVAYRGRGKVARIKVDDVQGSGTVTSVGLSMPAGFSVANTPVSSSGTITVTFAAGYGLPTTTQMGQWSTAFGWGDHASAGYALASAVTSALAGKVDTSDARLTNSREWTASTVSQAEAEAGTATTRRAWTAQRVWQAITAWWNASAAKSKLDGIQAGATANQTDAYLLNRANHTGTQAASTITGLATVATTGSYNDLTGKPSIPAGTVTSVGLSAPTGFSVSGSPVTGSGTLALTFASGYSLPTTVKQGQWDQAYGWGNHASAGYALSSSLVWSKDGSGLASYDGKVAAGDALTSTRLNSGGGPRAFNLIDANATVRVWRYAASGAAFELINGTNNDSTSSANAYWDIALAGTGTGDSSRLLFRNRTGGMSTLLTLMGGGGVGIGTQSPSEALHVVGNVLATGTINGRNLDADGQIIDGLPADVASQSWVNAQLADLGGDVKVWIATTGPLTKNAFHKVDFSANRTLTLPASPAENDFVEIYANGGNATGSTIARNGQTIMGLAENLSIDAPMTHIRLVYSGSTWRIAS